MNTARALLFAVLAASVSTAAAADGDPAKGEKVFRKCSACHAVGDGAKNKVGPVLNGIVDAPIASVEGFRYSNIFLAKKEEGFVWTEDLLAAYFANPKGFLPGNKMSFVGLKKDDEIADVIAYLKTFE